MKRFFQRRQTVRPVRDLEGDGLLAGLHILIVEDDHDLRRLVRATLELEAALVSEADGLPRALSIVERGPCDAVITDITLGHSRRDGVRLLQRLKATPALATIPVIAMTGCKGLEPELDGHGFDRVLIKPFAVFDLVPTIRALVPAATFAAA